MKKLGLKLGLSCAALAACATTLVSTTFAWYTSNTEVTATGLTASTESASDSVLQISLDGTTWGATVKLDKVVSNLTPVQRTAGEAGVPGTFAKQNMGGTTNPVGETGDASNNYVQFNLYFRDINMSATSKPNGENVYIKAVTTSNNHAGGVDTLLLSDIGNYTAAANTYYKVDLYRALDLEIVAKNNTTAVAAGQKVNWTTEMDTAYTGQATSLYNLESYAGADTLKTATGWDALDYYNTVKGLTGDAVATRSAGYAEPTTGLSSVINKAGSALGTIASSRHILKTTWTLYLDGWDKACFDAVKGQAISFDFTFTTALATE